MKRKSSLHFTRAFQILVEIHMQWECGIPPLFDIHLPWYQGNGYNGSIAEIFISVNGGEALLIAIRGAVLPGEGWGCVTVCNSADSKP